MLRLLLGLVLAPTSFLALLSAVGSLAGLMVQPGIALYFLAGFFSYYLFQIVFFKPTRLYVLGHELTHALAASLCGARLKGIQVNRQSGYVEMDRSNAFIALAPYCIPLYTLAVIVLYRIFLWSVAPARSPEGYAAYFLAAMGFSLSFHFAMTAETLRITRQSDLIQAGGMVFSLAVIALANSAVLIVCLKILFPQIVSVLDAARQVAHGSYGFWLAICKLFLWVANR